MSRSLHRRQSGIAAAAAAAAPDHRSSRAPRRILSDQQIVLSSTIRSFDGLGGICGASISQARRLRLEYWMQQVIYDGRALPCCSTWTCRRAGNPTSGGVTVPPDSCTARLSAAGQTRSGNAATHEQNPR
jgi:hypothetical protein